MICPVYNCKLHNMIKQYRSPPAVAEFYKIHTMPRLLQFAVDNAFANETCEQTVAGCKIEISLITPSQIITDLVSAVPHQHHPTDDWTPCLRRAPCVHTSIPAPSTRAAPGPLRSSCPPPVPSFSCLDGISRPFSTF